MSTRWARISRRPSSNTAKRPIGPAPTINTSVSITSLIIIIPAETASALLGRRGDGEPVELGPNLDLAGEARARLHLISEVEHVFFHLRGLADNVHEVLADIDVAGRAGTGATAFGDDLRHRVADRRFHHGGAFLGIDGSRRPVRVDVGDLDHALRTLRRDEGADKRRPSLRPRMRFGERREASSF